MLDTPYTYVDGANLVGLILEVRDEFLRRVPYELDDSRQPNSVRLVAVSVLETRPASERLAVSAEIDDMRAPLFDLNPSCVFAHSASPRDCISDLICAVIVDVLRRDDEIRIEDDRRMDLAAESEAELVATWSRADSQ